MVCCQLFLYKLLYGVLRSSFNIYFILHYSASPLSRAGRNLLFNVQCRLCSFKPNVGIFGRSLGTFMDSGRNRADLCICRDDACRTFPVSSS